MGDPGEGGEWVERDQASFSTGRGVARGEDGRGSLDGSGSDGSGYRDREPPPSYTGKDPEATFQAFERSVKLWEFETDVPRTKRGQNWSGPCRVWPGWQWRTSPSTT